MIGDYMKLSEFDLNYLLRCSSLDFKRIVFCELESSFNEVCDVGIVLGGRSMIPNRASKAISLYREGLINKILVSGGVGYCNIDRFVTEAEKLRKYLLKNGVFDSDIIVEDKSKDTIENINNSLDILRDLFDLNDISLALITSDFHMKRSLGLLRGKFSNNIEWCGVVDEKIDYDSLQGRLIILKEVIQLIRLSKAGIIEDEDIKGLSFVKK